MWPTTFSSGLSGQAIGRDVQPLTMEIGADIAAARSRVMHALYVGAHGTGVTLTEHVKDLQHRLQIDARRRRPLSERPKGAKLRLRRS
jgi:hypothetical protein